MDRQCRNRNITINDIRIDVVDSYKFLGVQAKKAMFNLYKKIRNLYLPIDCQLKLFDSTIVPILTYGCEVWGYGKLKMIVKVHTDFLKYILNVKQGTSQSLLYGELGRFALYIVINKIIVVVFWYNLLFGGYKLSSTLYSIIFQDHINYDRNYTWLING